MNKIIIPLFAVLLMATSAFGFGETEEIITLEKLPPASQKTIKKYFEDEKIALVKKIDTLFIKTEYKVAFANGITMEFDQVGIWKEIKGAKDGVPEELVPQKITKYVEENYPRTKITAIERKEDEGAEIKLSNRMELEFDNLFRLTNLEKDDD